MFLISMSMPVAAYVDEPQIEVAFFLDDQHMGEVLPCGGLRSSP
jgi:hypothetical protein